MHLKRWLLLAFLGITILGLGAAIFLVDLYRRYGLDNVTRRLLADRRGPGAPDPGRRDRRRRA